MSDWHRSRVEAAARALAAAGTDDDAAARAEAAVRAADRAAGGVVPQGDYERLALQLSAWRVRALQTDELLDRALRALDRVADATAATSSDVHDLASFTAVELRTLLDAQRTAVDERAQPGG